MKSMMLSEKDEKDYLINKIRELEKKLRISEKANTRFSKYINQLHEPLDESDEVYEKANTSSDKVCGISGCQSTDFFYLSVRKKQYITCKDCGNRHVEDLGSNRK